MKLTLRLAPHEDAPGETRTLEHGTLTLGRSAEQDWVLGDPERTISKLHCRIDRSGDGFLLTDLSTNGVFLNGDPAPIGRGQAHALSDGDEIALGPFTLRVGITPDAAAEPEIDLVRPAAPTLPVASLPTAYSGAPQTAGSPLAQIEEPWLETIPNGGFGPDLRAAPLGWEAPPDPATYAATGARPDQLPPLIPPTEFAEQSEHLSAISTLMHTPAPAVVLPMDWNDADPMDSVELAPSRLAEDMLAPPPAPAPAPPIPEPVAARTEPAPPVMAPATTAPGPLAAAGHEPLLAGFLDGAGLSAAAFAGLDPHAAGHDLGRLVRSAIEGVRDVLATRAMVKAELRVDQTIVQARDNNAMKFAPDVQRCIDAMVGEPPPAFMPGAAAMQQSLDDIKRHELALIAALNSVFTEISTQLDPESIRARARADNSFGAALPMMREAACWAIYEQRFAALQGGGGAQNTGGSLLSPLAAAYARQVRGTAPNASPLSPIGAPPIGAPPIGAPPIDPPGPAAAGGLNEDPPR